MRIEWTARARKALTAAITYAAQDNPAAALVQLDEIEFQTDRLIEHPEIGRIGRLKGTRELMINRTPFIVVYRTNGEVIQIMHILHGARLWLTSTDQE